MSNEINHTSEFDAAGLLIIPQVKIDGDLSKDLQDFKYNSNLSEWRD